MIKLCVFDFDSTLMDGETINLLAHSFHQEDEVSKITKRAMAGELDFYESLTKRVSLLRGMPLQTVQEISRNLPFIEGASEIISYLKAKSIKVVVFSGGFHIATDEAQKILKFDTNFANILHHKDGILTGNVAGEMMFSDSKGKMLKRLKELLHLDSSQVATIGDGANDVSMFKEADTKIAFCANKILKDEANFIVDKKDLRELKQIL